MRLPASAASIALMDISRPTTAAAPYRGRPQCRGRARGAVGPGLRRFARLEILFDGVSHGISVLLCGRVLNNWRVIRQCGGIGPCRQVRRVPAVARILAERYS